MNRDSYDRATLRVFDIIGSFFVDTFYNGHYLLADQHVKGGRASSITDAYRSIVIGYMNGISSRPDLCNKAGRDLHNYHQKYTAVTSFADFEDRLLSVFIPKDYYNDFDSATKDRTMHDILVRTANEFGAIIVSGKMLHRIIDDHMNKNNVTLLQDKMVDILITQRCDYYEKFASVISGKNTGDTVSKALLNKLKDAFVAEKKAGCKAQSDLERAIAIIRQLVAKTNEQSDEIARLSAKLAGTTSALNAMKNVPTQINAHPPAFTNTLVTNIPQSYTRESNLFTTQPAKKYQKTPYPSESDEDAEVWRKPAPVNTIVVEQPATISHWGNIFDPPQVEDISDNVLNNASSNAIREDNNASSNAIREDNVTTQEDLDYLAALDQEEDIGFGSG